MKTPKKQKECRNQVAEPRSRKDTAWCQNCKHLSYCDIQHNCLCCTKKIIKEITHASALKRFEKIVTSPQHRKVIDEWCFMPYDHQNGPFWIIKIGHQVFGVDIKYFAEYIQLTNMEGVPNPKFPNDTKWDSFIKAVRKKAQLVAVTWSDEDVE